MSVIAFFMFIEITNFPVGDFLFLFSYNLNDNFEKVRPSQTYLNYLEALQW